jgi:hypothetical protein
MDLLQLKELIMKYKIIANFLLAFLLFHISACTKDYEEINTNPNSQVQGSNEGLLLGAEIGAASVLLDNPTSYNSGMGKWVEYYTVSPNDVNFIPSNPEDNYNDFWIYQGLVTSTIPLLDRVISNTDKTPQPNYKAAALIMKAWIYHSMTNLWGPIPFTDADKGEVAETPEYNKPKFNTQEEIYHGVLALLDSANNLFDLSGNVSVSMNAASDAYAGGDISAWKKFGNTLRARILLNMSDADPAFAKTELEKIFSNPAKYPVLQSSGEDFGMNWVKESGQAYSDPFNQYLINSANPPAASSGIVNILGERKDPRMKVYFDPAKGYTDKPTYVGAPPSFDADNSSGFIRIGTDSISHISAKFSTPQVRPIITYSELMFIKAEAALKNINVGISALEAYEAGINANMESVGIDPASSVVRQYLQGQLVAYDPSKALEQIVTQRYISQFGQSTNTFSLIRRTGYPELDYFTIGVNKQYGYPVRIRYTLENFKNYNNENFQAAIAGTNIVNQMWGDKLWFAQNAPDVKMYPTIQQGPVKFSY